MVLWTRSTRNLNLNLSQPTKITTRQSKRVDREEDFCNDTDIWKVNFSQLLHSFFFLNKRLHLASAAFDNEHPNNYIYIYFIKTLS
jgi:hypothetical protein